MKKRLTRKEFILIVLLLMVVGALLGRHFHTTGLVISIVVMSLYLAIDLPRIAKYTINYRRISGRNRLRIALWLAMLLVTIGALLKGSVFYLMLLILLGIDYLVTDKQMKK